MENKIARIISIAFHPLIMPTLGIYLIFSADTYLSSDVHEKAQQIIFIWIFLNTFLVPALIAWYLKRKNFISNLRMDVREERTLPFLVTSIFYFLSYYLVYRIELPQTINSLMLGASLAVFLAFLINLKWKISIHMIGISGLAGALFGLSVHLNADVFFILIGVIFIAGLVGYARLVLNAHTQGEVYSGFLLGFACEAIPIIYQIG